MNIVVDMMGSDNGSKVTVGAIKEYLKDHNDINFICVGNEEELKELENTKNVKLVYSKTVCKMDEDPLDAMRKTDSSLVMATNELMQNDYDALISAGGTASVLTVATFKVKRLPNVKRPGLLTSFPTYLKDKKMTVCDLGANTVNTAEELEQFAIMSNIFYKHVYKVEKPAIYQLNVGTEEEKGKEENKKAYQLLKNNPNLNFKGNMEAREAMKGEVDCLITDGFSGNIFLKATEGCAKIMSQMLKEGFKTNLFTKLGYLLSKKGVDSLKQRMDYKNVGGAMLIGVNKVVVKAHGSSDVKSFLSAINLTKTLVESNVIEEFKKQL